MSWDIEAFREKVESQHVFPGHYNFKFIVPQEQKDAILLILPPSELSFKDSANGKYVSIRSNAFLASSQEVLDIYMLAFQVPGCMSL
ncbi:MAG: hypothetical protein ACJA08_002962 [Cyclobacteriaceae bacterium]|jgi:hypothetical protein